MELPEAFRERMLACMPGLVANSVRINQDGLINDVLIVDEELVFRFPKSEEGRHALAQEARVLDLVHGYVTLPVPRVTLHPNQGMTYRLIRGQALQQHVLLAQAQQTQERLAEQLGTFLRQLHTIPAGTVAQHGIGAAGSVRLREDWVALYHAVERELFPLLMANAREWVGTLFAPLLDGSLELSYDPALIHGDLGPYHVLYDQGQQCIAGVIDFGTAGLGDPADDFANIINAQGEHFLRRMIPYYPQIAATLDRARFWASTLELQWALGGIRSGDRSWFTVHIGRARDVMPIGVTS
jgi:aminoglycoside 2''-phosphotransferase